MGSEKKYYLGIDVGSSFVKTCLFDAETGVSVALATTPETEQPILSRQPGWAEQDPRMWWDNFETGFRAVIRESGVDPRSIGAIGIAYQMHGLVLLDEEHRLIRDSIIWCDSRAVDIGNNIFSYNDRYNFLSTVLNSPGNFTASRIRWVHENEPETYARIRHAMLPGDYMAHRLCGSTTTTNGGLSEAILWNFRDGSVSKEVLSAYGIDPAIIPDIVPSIGQQGAISNEIAARLGLDPSTAVTYRTGDQPNNAFSLGVMNPGQVAATAGTSGVLYAITDKNTCDNNSYINTFLHVNNTLNNKRNAALACLNGTGILYKWLRGVLCADTHSFDYESMNALAARSPAGARGLHVFPFGNGSERILGNRFVCAHVMNLDFNQHDRTQLIRAALEGIVYALRLGFESIEVLGLRTACVHAAHANLFLSSTFTEVFSNVLNIPVRLFQTSGAEGAARGAALGAGFYSDEAEAFKNLSLVAEVEPSPKASAEYENRFAEWKTQLENQILQSGPA